MSIEEIKEAVRTVIRDEMVMATVVPDFAGYAYFKIRFGIAQPTLKKLADNGHVRRKKVGEAVQAQALYKVADVEEWFESDKGVEA